jgi:uncharacterized protein YqeY
MGLREQLTDDLKEAMRHQEERRNQVVRELLAG